MNLNQVTLPSRDVARGRDFYLQLGFTLIVNSAPRYVRLAAPAGGATLSLHAAESMPAGDRAIAYFECLDVDAQYARLVEAGITFDHAPRDQDWLWREAHFADPDGNRFCLYYAGKNRLDPPWRVGRGVEPPVIEFWYEFASTYSYPAAMRIEAEAGARGLAVRWRPFLLGPIFKARGQMDSPFNTIEAKGRYMWRDLERITSSLGLAFNRPDIFPQNGLTAARVALALEAENLTPAFSRAVYIANFARGQDIALSETLAQILEEIGADPENVLARAASPETKQRLKAQTDEALSLGMFGAPNLRVAGELFWGNDRMEAALDWALRPAADRVSRT
jgi:2-hydroxychromene-2-carboxylate isomerase/predicted enzyme related to lactoylglutathione lyase